MPQRHDKLLRVWAGNNSLSAIAAGRRNFLQRSVEVTISEGTMLCYGCSYPMIQKHLRVFSDDALRWHNHCSVCCHENELIRLP